MSKSENEPSESFLARTMAIACLAGLTLGTTLAAWPTAKQAFEHITRDQHNPQPTPDRQQLTVRSLSNQIKTGHPELAQISPLKLDLGTDTFTFTIPAQGSLPQQDCRGHFTNSGQQAEATTLSCNYNVKLAH